MRDIIKQKVLETKKSLVLEEISKIFENDGFSSVKMQDIANRLGISVGALYKLFSSKDDLFYEYIAFQIKLFHNMLVEKCSSLSHPKLCLEIYVKLKFDIFIAKRKAIEDPIIGDPLFFFKMNIQKSDPAKPIFKFLAELFERLDQLEPLKEKNYMKLAYLFNAFTMGYIEYWINYNERLEESASVVLEEFLEGMKE